MRIRHTLRRWKRSLEVRQERKDDEYFLCHRQEARDLNRFEAEIERMERERLLRQVSLQEVGRETAVDRLALLSRWIVAAVIAESWWRGFTYWAHDGDEAAPLVVAFIVGGVLSGLLQATIAIEKAKLARENDPADVVDLSLPRFMRATAVMWFVIFAVELGAQDALYLYRAWMGYIPY